MNTSDGERSEAAPAGFALHGSTHKISEADRASLDSDWSDPTFYAAAMAEMGIFVPAGGGIQPIVGRAPLSASATPPTDLADAGHRN